MPRTAQRKKGQKKDPDAPKRPPTAFFLFAKDRRPQIKAEQPEAKVTDVAKILGEEWRGLADNSKRKYQEEAARLKEIYDQEKAKFESRHDKDKYDV